MNTNIDEILKKLKPILGKKAERLWLAYQTETDAKKRRELEGLIKILGARLLKESFEQNLLLNLPESKEISGKYSLGKVYYNKKPRHEFGLKEEEMTRHIGIFGMSGSGKTNIAHLILSALLDEGKPFLIFDWKRNYRSLLKKKDAMVSILGFDTQATQPALLNPRVFTVGREVAPFRFNPLIPPKETSPQVWLNKIIEVMSHAYFLGHGVAHLLQKALDSVYRQSGLYNGKVCQYPTFEDVREWLNLYKTKGREAGWMDSTKRAVEALCFGDVGEVFNTRTPPPTEEILKKPVCLELDGLRNSEKTFFTEAMLLWIHQYRLAEGGRGKFKHAIIIEEAHHVLHRKKQEVEGEESITDIILREIRELGESIIILDQHPSLISLPALGNTYCTIAMNLKTWADVKAVSDAMLLEPKDRKFLGELDVGEGIVKLSGRYPKPFLVKFPKVEFEYISDKTVEGKMSRYFEERRLFHKIEPKRRAIPALPEEQKEEEKQKNLEIEEEEFLMDIADYPVSPVVERYERLGLSASKGTRIQKQLIKKDFIKASKVGKSEGGSIKFLELKEQGVEALKSRGRKINVSLSTRHGGPTHRYWVHKIAEHLKKRGFRVEKEKPLGEGKTVDIVGVKDGKTIAIEVETGKSDAIGNIKKDLEAGFDEVVSVALTKQVQVEIEQKLADTLLTKASVKVVNIRDL